MVLWAKSSLHQESSQPMVTLSVLYPKRADSHFDHVYYLQSNLPLS